jgi:pre-mRNA-processing factor 17
MLVDYDSADDEAQSVQPHPSTASRSLARLNAAPSVFDKRPARFLPASNALTLDYNPKLETMYAPTQGAHHPLRNEDNVKGGTRNIASGFVEDAAIPAYEFEEQYYTFKNYGHARNPTAWAGPDSYVGTGQGSESIWQRGKNSKAAPLKRKHRGDVTSEYLGPWAPFEGVDDNLPVAEQQHNDKKQRADAENAAAQQRDAEKKGDAAAAADAVQKDDELQLSANDPKMEKALKAVADAERETQQALAEVQTLEEKAQTKADDKHEQQSVDSGKSEAIAEGEEIEGYVSKQPHNERTEFHGREFYDYQGRSYISPPTHLKNHEHECFIPKKHIHTFNGHSKGVNCVKFFPQFGHIMLSGSLDSTVKIWNVYGKRECLRTIYGHEKGVRDMDVSLDGTRFLTASYDGYVKLWDTETGACISRFSNGERKIPYCVRFNPAPELQHYFVSGYSDKKVLQWNCNSGKITQKYDEHLGSVNAIAFSENGRQFVSSSDDKSLRVWTWGIPVVIKYIAEPHMHAMPSMVNSPDGELILCQSLDNQLLVYNTRDKFRQVRKKRFTGHTVAGYACQVGWSPDAQYVMSGDAEGKLFFWDYKTCKNFRTLRAHAGPVMGCAWHPIQPSWVASCSWDGTIKLWD